MQNNQSVDETVPSSLLLNTAHLSPNQVASIDIHQGPSELGIRPTLRLKNHQLGSNPGPQDYFT
jgi:hypothetical protein